MPTAFISVYDKTDLEALARPLVEQYDYDLVATGGTRRYLMSAGLPVKDLSDITGFDELLGGRVKSLHPVVFASILAKQDKAEDLASLTELPPFDLVCVNLYPFEQGLAQRQSGEKPDLDLIELIDIGGSALIRAAAKNHQYLSVLCHPKQYDSFLQGLEKGAGQAPLALRKQLALQAFKSSAGYDSAISNWLSGGDTTANTTAFNSVEAAVSEPLSTEAELPGSLTIKLTQTQPMRYGENPHQAAALYQLEGLNAPLNWPADELLNGKPLSYNNVVDMEAAWSLLSEFSDEPTVAIIKHTQPCGVASGTSIEQAFQRALDCDPLSAFGGIVVLNRTVDKLTAEAMAAMFLEVIVAPSFSPDALERLQKKKNLRLVARYWPDLEQGHPHPATRNDGWWLRQVGTSKVLLQKSNYLETESQLEQNLTVVTQTKPSVEQLKDLAFAWRVCKHVKSNAIVVAKEAKTLGLCGGQTSRVGALEQAITQACDEATEAVLASDGFFPAIDNIQIAAQNRIAAIIQPGGSIKDAEVIAACDEAGIAMVTTSVREFRH